MTIAALINALKLTGRKFEHSKLALIGAGAANMCNYKHLKVFGARPENIIVVDPKGILHREREDIEETKKTNPWKYQVAVETNPECRRGGIREALREADVVIAASRPGLGVIKKEWIREMNKDPIVFAEANPIPEIWPWEAKEAGARVIATGRSDFPNQINNSLGFPAVFRGVLTVRARKMTDEMFYAAAVAIAKYSEETDIHEERIIGTIAEPELYVKEAIAIAEKAIELGYARRKLSRSELEAEIRGGSALI